MISNGYEQRNASVDFFFDVKNSMYFMHVNVYFKNYTRQYKIQITKEEYEICTKEDKR